MTSQLTLGVIGHVDHGKTSLVRELTGIETDRLKEEKERGLSIVLGFSYLEFPDFVVDLIDVPGHEDFIRSMISGATGMDGVLLVIASNEGVMPQTREHFNIAQLLGIDCGLVVLTKTDLVTDEELILVEQEVSHFLEGSFLEQALVIKTSVVESKGLKELRTACGLLERSYCLPTESSEGSFLPIDRVFSMHGFGSVVTGTLRLGTLEVNESVEILPGGEIATIRGLQNHNKPVNMAMPGQRVAVNLRNVKHEELRRGNVLSSPGFLKTTSRIDVDMQLLDHLKHDLKNGSLVRVMLGTSEVIAKIRLLEQNTLTPGSSGLVQLICQSDVVTHRTERVVIRNISPVFTLGGGRILDLDPPRHRRFDNSVMSRLQSTVKGDISEIFSSTLTSAGMLGMDIGTLRESLDIHPKDMEMLVKSADAVRIEELRIVDKTSYQAFKAEVLSTIDEFHVKNPRRQGVSIGGISSRLINKTENSVLLQVVRELEEEAELCSNGAVFSRINFDVLDVLSETERFATNTLEEHFRSAGLASPSVDTVLQNRSSRDAYSFLIEIGALIRLKTYDRTSNFVLHRDVLGKLEKQLQEQFPYPVGFSVSEARDFLGTTRKYIIPLLEHLDGTGVTARAGNVRRLREN
jgi:selenocysteine-specific elongation factor